MRITYDATLNPGADQYYGEMVLSNLLYEDGASIQVNSYLAMTFNSPAPVDETGVSMQFGETWVGVTVTTDSVAIGTNLYSVSMLLSFATPHTMDAKDTITIEVNGDLTTNTDTYLDSFVIAADQAPDVNGMVSVACAAAPDPALSDIKPVITLTRGSQTTPVTLHYGTTTSIVLQQGEYTVQGDDIRTSDLTVSAPLVISPATLTVSPSATVAVNVAFGTIQRMAALDVVIDTLTDLEAETLDITLLDEASGTTIASFASPVGSTTQLRELPVSGPAQFEIDHIALNNGDYSFEVPDVTLANALQTVNITDQQVTRTQIDTTGFMQVRINVTAGATLPTQISLRLTGDTMNYTQTIDVETYSTAFDVPLEPGVYTVSAPTFLFGGVVYEIDVPDSLTVGGSTASSLNVSIAPSANLNVRGFPSFLSFGGCADLAPTNADDFIAARASSMFIYAGTDGAGDSTDYLEDDPQTRALIELARNVEANLNGQAVLPVLISYTCNLSLGDTLDVLADADAHAHSFANYILALNIANGYVDAAHPVPAGFIVNPDFLGACQQASLPPGHGMPVRAPLQTAMDHWSITTPIPPGITEDIQGYVAAVNWLTRTVAPKVTFGWQINLWGVGYSEWIYDDSNPADWAQQTADYIESLAVYSGDNTPDFLAIDRYEADDFTQRAYIDGYCYGPREWQRYFDFCEGVSRALKLPVMPWQIPARRTPNTTDQVNTDFDSQHWGTGGSCILGDPAIGWDYHNVNATILGLQFPTSFPAMGATAEDMYIRSEPFDISAPMYTDFPLRGIFAVLLGGGSTTGLVSAIGNPEPWTREKINAYMNDPISFDDTGNRKRR